MKKIIITMCFLLSSCATYKTLEATGGSKSDGTIELSYSFSHLESPVVDFEDGLKKAKERCSAWGYSDAQAFGGSKNQCNKSDGFGYCTNTTVSMQYQCID